MHKLACRLRTACALMASQALETLSTLDPDVLVGPTEAEVRTFIHDFVTADHDKDIRSFGAFALDEFVGKDVYTLIVD